MLFLQVILYSSSFVGALKNEILEAALELCQLKLSRSHQIFSNSGQNAKIILLLLTVLWFFAAFSFYFMQARVDWILINFGTQVIKKKRPIRPVFPDYLSVSYDYGFNDFQRYWFPWFSVWNNSEKSVKVSVLIAIWPSIWPQSCIMAAFRQ